VKITGQSERVPDLAEAAFVSGASAVVMVRTFQNPIHVIARAPKQIHDGP
jgi:hypothetical protein